MFSERCAFKRVASALCFCFLNYSRVLRNHKACFRMNPIQHVLYRLLPMPSFYIHRTLRCAIAWASRYHIPNVAFYCLAHLSGALHLSAELAPFSGQSHLCWRAGLRLLILKRMCCADPSGKDCCGCSDSVGVVIPRCMCDLGTRARRTACFDSVVDVFCEYTRDGVSCGCVDVVVVGPCWCMRDLCTRTLCSGIVVNADKKLCSLLSSAQRQQDFCIASSSLPPSFVCPYYLRLPCLWACRPRHKTAPPCGVPFGPRPPPPRKKRRREYLGVPHCISEGPAR